MLLFYGKGDTMEREDPGLLSRPCRKRRPSAREDGGVSGVSSAGHTGVPEPLSEARDTAHSTGFSRIPVRCPGTLWGPGLGEAGQREARTMGGSSTPSFHQCQLWEPRDLGQRAAPSFLHRPWSGQALPSAGESGLVSRGSQGLRSPLESRRGSLGAP